jgi:Na+/H+ antiporter NhaD/arsenite permease-like protein
MQSMAGRIVVGIIGGIIIGYCIYNLYRACSEDFENKLDLSAMSASQKKWAFRAGKAGYTAMFVNYSFLGSFLIASAFKAES